MAAMTARPIVPGIRLHRCRFDVGELGATSACLIAVRNEIGTGQANRNGNVSVRVSDRRGDSGGPRGAVVAGRVPVIAFTGYLGAGKRSLLDHLLRSWAPGSALS